MTQFAVFGRLLGIPVLGAVWLWYAGLPEYSAFVTVGMLLYLLHAPLQITALLRHGQATTPAMLTISAVLDAFALCFLTAGLWRYGDPIFAWYVGQVALLSIRPSQQQSRRLTALMVASYVLGHILGGSFVSPILYLFVAIKAAVLVLANYLISHVLGVQKVRQSDLQSHQDEVVQLNQKLERSVAELRAITEITELIHSTLDVETVGPTLLDILEKVINIPAASLYVIDKSKQETIFSTSSVGAGTMPRAYSGLELAGALRPTSSAGALSCIELADHNQMLVVFCADGEAVDSLTADDRIVLGAVASELVVAVENSRLYRLTKRLAITDELTDLFNYRYLQQRLDDELGRAERYNKRLSLIMLDLDDFKRINDTQGHLVGDSVLFEIGQLLKSTVREVDVVARYGGEEFTVILPETDASGAFIVAEKIREAISLHRFADADGVRTIHLTASIGLSSFPVHAQDKESLLRSADDAVYHAKGTGKDRVRAPRLRLRRLPSEQTPEETAE